MTGVPERPKVEQHPSLLDPTEAKYHMLWGGAWRPVTYMRNETGQVFDPQRAVAAVLYLGPDAWQATTVRPGDILLRDDGWRKRWDDVS